MMFERLTHGEAPRIFGDDYPTPDGTCIRDYIHVADLAEAHLAVARRLDETGAGDLTLNVGRGEGVSVRELADVIGEVTGSDLEPVVEPRRAGDAPKAVASAVRITGSWAGRPGGVCARWSSRPGRAGACTTPRPVRDRFRVASLIVVNALTCGTFPQVRAHDNGVQSRVAPYPPPVVHWA